MWEGVGRCGEITRLHDGAPVGAGALRCPVSIVCRLLQSRGHSLKCVAAMVERALRVLVPRDKVSYLFGKGALIVLEGLHG